ncbi:MAG: matrixin family metalloprotease [Chloroflexota bacterium]
MKKAVLLDPLKTGMQVVLLLALLIFSSGAGGINVAHAKSSFMSTDSETTAACGDLLANAEAAFLATLAPDGSVPASPEMKRAASEYIRVSKLCYEETEANNPAGALQEETPLFIDDGGIMLGSENSADFILTNAKWGSSTMGTSGGTVTYSFMGNGINLSSEPNSTNFGTSVAITSLPGFQACFITDIQMAFAAWQAVSNIRFVQVTDNGAAFNTTGAIGDIRIGTHAFDAPYGVLAHAYFPYPGISGAGDIHFDSAENWTCNTSGVDIGIVALHEIGHSLGLNHENTATVAVMDPYYNTSLTGLQSDDISGSTAIYGVAQLSSPPVNDNFANASTKTIGSVPYTDSLDTTGAVNEGDGPTVPGSCDGKQLRKGLKNVWYQYTSASTKQVFIDTFGSTPPSGVQDYDTYIAVWRGPNINTLTLVGCDDDDIAGLQSQLSLSAQAGVTYYIEVAQYNGTSNGAFETPTGGTLKLHVTSFGDVSGTYWAWRWIEGFYNLKITTGCSQIPINYCPERPVTRAEMAVFLLRAKHSATFVPNPTQTGTFADLPVTGKEWMKPWVEQFYEEGITTGCAGAPFRYCPERPVTRAEMAVFILRAKYGTAYQPNPTQTGIFADVPVTGKEWMQPWIERFYEEGITVGCAVAPLRYCPEREVTRAEMAVFIDRAFGIPQLP